MIESAEKTGAPDPLVVSIMTHSTAWVECWNKTFYKGVLPQQAHRDVPNQLWLRTSLAIARLSVPKWKAESLTEDKFIDLLDNYRTSKYLTKREKSRGARSWSPPRKRQSLGACGQLQG